MLISDLFSFLTINVGFLSAQFGSVVNLHNQQSYFTRSSSSLEKDTPGDPPFKTPEDRYVTVETSKGAVKGQIVILYDGPNWNRKEALNANSPMRVTTFLGIPYAEPPVRDLRFRPPRERASWRPSSLNALEYGPICPQPKKNVDVISNGFRMDEDCLYLNVFTPNISELTYPVMVFIHGGAFYWGASNLFPGHMLAASQGVVVVTFNYRLGALGFLSTGDGNSPGNYGMLDQVLAIQWVKDNIQVFKGDSNHITIFGQGAGGASVGLHTLSLQSRGNFHSAIAQSGSELAPWAVVEDREWAWKNSRKFGEHVSVPCPINSSKLLIDCLRYDRQGLELGEAAEYESGTDLFMWAPVVDVHPMLSLDQRFLPNKPEVLLATGNYDRNMPFLSTVTQGEGFDWLPLVRNPKIGQDKFLVAQQDLDDAVRGLLTTDNRPVSLSSRENVLCFTQSLWQDAADETKRRLMFVNLYSDIYYKCPASRSLTYRIGVPAYPYVFNYQREATLNQSDPEYRMGFVQHMEDLWFVFGFPFLDNDRQNFIAPTLRRKRWGQEDRKISDLIMQTWGNFAKGSSPISVRAFDTTWKKYPITPSWEKVVLQCPWPIQTSSPVGPDRQAETLSTETTSPVECECERRAKALAAMTVVEVEREHYRIATWILIAVCAVILLLLLVVCTLYVRQRKGLDEIEF